MKKQSKLTNQYCLEFLVVDTDGGREGGGEGH